jgi:hypothetical protein
VRAINLRAVIIHEDTGSSSTRIPTCSMASLTRSDPMRLFFTRLVIRAWLVSPELRQAMLKALLCNLTVGALKEREDPRRRLSLVRNGTVNGNTRKARGKEIV